MQGLQNLLKKEINLETLVMYNCDISKIKKTGQQITPVKRLKSLNLSYNPGIVEDFKDWQAIVSSSLLELTLSNCAISKINSVMKLLKSAPNLESLDLSENSLLNINSTLADCLNQN